MPAGSRRRRADDDEGSEEEHPSRRRRNHDDTLNEEEDDEEEAEGDTMGGGASTIDILAKKMIRYVMACDYRRHPIRRDGIKEKVLGDEGRAFRKVLEAAQVQLRQIWGMELRELPMREKHTLEEKRKAIRAQSQAKPGSQAKTSSGVYMLSSILPAKYRTPAIIAPSKAPSIESEASYVAFYHMVITLIMLNGGELSEAKLMRYLRRLNAEQNLGTETTETTLKRMQTQNYVVKHVQKEAGTQNQDERDNIVWSVGPRGQEEVGIDGASGLIREVWGPQENENDKESLEKKIRASFGLKEVKSTDSGGAEEADGTPAAGPSGTQAES